MTPADLGALLHYAMRYAMGRYTYAVDDVTRMLREQWASITDSDRRQISLDLIREIERHEYRGETIGDERHHKQWRNLRDFMVEHRNALSAATRELEE